MTDNLLLGGILAVKSGFITRFGMLEVGRNLYKAKGLK